MAIHYDPKSKRFRDERGFVSKERAMRSSVARREFEKAQGVKVSRAKPKTKRSPAKKSTPKKTTTKPTPKAKPKVKPPASPRVPPWEIEGDVREYPAPDEWFPEVDLDGWDELLEDWGDYVDEETDSAGTDGS